MERRWSLLLVMSWSLGFSKRKIKIDLLVCKLYNLSKEEIEIID